jgi:O-antigen ligase
MSRLSNLITRHDPTSCIVVLIAGFIFLNPFPHVTAFKEISFYSAIGLIGLAVLLKKGDFSFDAPLSTAFVCILLWACIGILFAINKPNTIHDLYAHLIKYFAVYFMIVNYFDSREKLNALSWVIILSASCFCLWSVSYYYFLLSRPFTDQLGVAVFMEIPTNIIGIVAIFGILLSLQKLNGKTEGWLRNALLAMVIVMTLTTLLTQTRGAVIAMFSALIILSFRNRKVLIFIILVTILLSLLPIKSRLTPSGIVDKLKQDERIGIALNYIEVIKDFPIQGIGFGLQSYADETFMRMYYNRVDPARRPGIIFAAPHNFVIDILVRLGIVGLALYLYVLYRAFGMILALAKDDRDDERKGWGFTFFAALVAYLIQGMFENVHSGPPAVVFYSLLAMITILWKRYRIEQMERGINTTE